MQGSYKSKGLPRPYYMKPHQTKKNSPYNKAPTQFFNTPRRKMMGYLVLVLLFGSLMWTISQDMKPKPDPVYEVERQEPQVGRTNDIGKNVAAENSRNLDKDSKNVNLAGNKAQGSKGEIGVGVAEAPKGGVANEAPMVGNDKDEIVDGAPKKIKAPLNVAI